MEEHAMLSEVKILQKEQTEYYSKIGINRDTLAPNHIALTPNTITLVPNHRK